MEIHFSRPSTAGKSKRDFGIVIAVSIVLVVAILVCVPIVYSIWYQTHFRGFISALSDSTVYAYQAGSLSAQAEGAPVEVTGDQSYLLFSALTEQMGKIHYSAPEEEPRAVLTYGDGAILELWAAELENSDRWSTGVLWRFTSPEGKIWIYDSDLVNPNTIWSIFSLM